MRKVSSRLEQETDRFGNLSFVDFLLFQSKNDEEIISIERNFHFDFFIFFKRFCWRQTERKRFQMFDNVKQTRNLNANICSPSCFHRHASNRLKRDHFQCFQFSNQKKRIFTLLCRKPFSLGLTCPQISPWDWKIKNQIQFSLTEKQMENPTHIVNPVQQQTPKAAVEFENFLTIRLLMQGKVRWKNFSTNFSDVSFRT